jgi:hypothetical protein
MMQLTVGRSLRLAAQSYPESIALTFENSNITHGQFEAQSNRISRALIEIGLNKGDRLGVILPNSPFYLSVICGAAKAGIDVVHVPYKGAAPALVDLAGGQVDFVIDTLIAIGPFVDQGRAHILGVGGDTRSASRPQAPTFAEQGFGEFSAYSWGSVFAPGKTPSAVIERLNQAIAVAMQTPAFKARVTQVGGELLGPDTAQAATVFSERERDRWIPFIRKSGIFAE